MQSARAQPALSDLEPAPLADEEVADRHAHILEDDLGMIVLVPKKSERSENLDANRIARYQYHREACVYCMRALPSALCVRACNSAHAGADGCDRGGEGVGFTFVDGSRLRGSTEEHENLALWTDRARDVPATPQRTWLDGAAASNCVGAHHLCPLITYSEPSRRIVLQMLVASDEATPGSVIAKAERMCPSRRGSSHCFFCKSLPYFSRTCGHADIGTKLASTTVLTGAARAHTVYTYGILRGE